MKEYDEIINLPHYELKYHKKMTKEARAAQFAPFAALTGFSDDIAETGRLTNMKADICEDTKLIVDRKLQVIKKHLKEKPEVTILYFKKDKRKQGGAYIKYTGNIKTIDTIEQKIIFTNKKQIALDSIYDINMFFTKG